MCNVSIKMNDKNGLLKVRKNSITNSAYFVSLDTSYFSSYRFCLNIRTNYFFTPLLQGKIDNTYQENNLHIVSNK